MSEIGKDSEEATQAVMIGNPMELSPIKGILLTYCIVAMMSVLPIVIGSIRSSIKAPRVKGTRIHALFVPVICSVALFILYMSVKTVPKSLSRVSIAGFFTMSGIDSLSRLVGSILNWITPASMRETRYHRHIANPRGGSARDIHLEVSVQNVISLMIAIVVALWYVLTKHWIANNLFALAFCINAIELAHLDSVAAGYVLLSGLFCYDVFWVFGTDVMVTVAKSFDAPLKMIFPEIRSGSGFTMWGLGDVVTPGIFITLMLRFDMRSNRQRYLYYFSTIAAYCFGLLATFIALFMMKKPQPALLYIVPACLGTPLLLAFIRGELKDLFEYDSATIAVREIEEIQQQDENNALSVDESNKDE